jgi:TP901 family phage tail tape measure protein
MREIQIDLVANATQLAQELENASRLLNDLRGQGSVTGQSLSQSFVLASQAQKSFREQTTALNIQMRNLRAELAGQKQGLSALANSTKIAGLKLNDLAGSTDRMIALNKKSGEAFTSTEKKALDYLKTIKRLRADQAKLAMDQRSYKNALDATSVSVSRLRTAKGQLRSSNNDLGRSFRGVLGVANQVAGVFGFGLGLYGLVRLMRGAVSTISEFEQNIKTLASVSGATGVEMEKLSSLAIKVGSASRYGATGVAELMTELSRLGFAAEEIENMTEGITKLATATGEDLSTSAETVGNIIRAMGYDAENTGHIVDVMAVAFNKSALNLSRFRESIKYVSPLARSVGFSIENVSAVLAKLADAGVSGSMAGTSLRNIFMSLADESSDLSKRLGGATTNFDDFINSMEKLSLEGIEAGEMFGLIDRRAVTALQTTSDQAAGIRALSQEMEAANGTVDEMANIQMQSLANKTKIALSAWKGWILAIDQGDGAMASFIKGSLQSFSRGLEDSTRQMQLQSKQMEADVGTITLLEKVVANSNSTMDERLQIVRRLNEEYPEMFSGMRLEADNWAAIEQEIRKATQSKRDYLELQFIREDIDEASLKIKRLDEDFESLDRTTRLLYESLEGQSWAFQEVIEKIINIEKLMLPAKEKTRLMQQTIGDTTVTLEEFEKALLIKNGIKEYEAQMKRGVEASKQFIIQAFEAAKAVNQDEFVSENKAISDSYIDTMNREAAAVMQLGRTKQDAYRAGLDVAQTAIDAEIAYKEHLISVIDRQIVTGEAYYQEGYEQQKVLLFQIEQLRMAYGKVGDAAQESLKSFASETRKAIDLLKLQQSIEELRVRIAFDGVKQEEKLIEIRKRFGDLITAQMKEGDERNSQFTKNQLERELALQALEQSRIRERMALDKDAHDRRIAQLKREQQELLTSLTGQGETAREQQAEREIQALGVVFEQEQKQRRESFEAEKKRLEDELLLKKQRWGEETIEYTRIKENTDKNIRELDAQYLADSEQSHTDYINKLIDLNQQLYDVKVSIYKEEAKLIQRNGEFQRDLAQYEADRVGGLWDAMDLLGQRTQRIREQERRNHIEKLQEQQEILQGEFNLQKARIESLTAQLGAEGVDDTAVNAQIEGAKNKLEELGFEILKTDEALRRLLNPDLDISAWSDFISAMKDVGGQLTDIYQGMLDEQYRIASEERAIRDRKVSELQRDIEIQLRLNEQGFASNVQAYMQALDAEKKARDAALADEKKAAEEKRNLERVVQTINLLSSISNILKQESKWGLPGILTAAAGIGGLWALWGNSVSRAQSATTYEKGGSFKLNGRSHADGGIMLAPGHEAQGGEMVSVFSRQATQKYGSEIKSVTDSFNKGFYKNPGSGTSIDMKDVKAIRKLMESNESISIQGNHKIIKRGNKTTICRLN